MEFKSINLENTTIEIIDGDRGKNYPKQSEFYPEEYCLFLNAKNVTSNGFVFDELNFISKEKDAALRKGKLNRDDIVVTTRGTVGNIAYYNNGVSYRNIRINSGMVILRATNLEEFIPEYVYWLFRSPIIQNQIDAYRTGSAQPQLPITIMRKLIIIKPPIYEQKAIVKILSSIDEKIEINNKINKSLEEMAAAIFKHWFVDFEFPNENGEPYRSSSGEMVESELGMIPKGWMLSSLYDLADFINGTSFKKDEISDNTGIPIIKIAELKQGISAQTKFLQGNKPEKYFLNNGDILFSWSGNPETSIDTFIWYRGEGVLNQHIFKVEPYDLDKELLYLILKYFKKQFTNIASNKQTTGLGHVTVNDLKRIKIALPSSKEIISEFSNLVKPQLDAMFSNLMENNTLINTRDTLLPKLISGEIRVPFEE